MRILMTLFALALWAPVLYFQMLQAEKQQTAQLHQTTRALVPSANLALSEGQTKPVKQALEELAIDSKVTNYRVAIYDGNGQVLLSSFNEAPPAASTIPKDSPKWTALHDGRLAHRVPVHGAGFIYATQNPVDPVQLAITMAPVIAGSVLLTGLFAGFFVNSLERKSNRAVYNTVDELDERIKASGRPPFFPPGGAV